MTGVSCTHWYLKRAICALLRCGAATFALVGAGALIACADRGEVSDRPSWLRWALTPILPASLPQRDAPGTVEARAEPASGPVQPVSTSSDALPEPGFVSIGPTAASPAKPETSAIEMAQEVQLRLFEMVERGFMEEMYVDRSKTAHSNPETHYFVQIGSHQDIRLAERQIAAARMQFETLLAGFRTRIQPVDLAARGRFYRAHIGPFESAAGARALCGVLMERRQDCISVAEHRAAPKQDSGAATRANPAPGPAPTGELASAARDYIAPYVQAPRAQFAEQRTDDLPLFTAPGLPGVPD